MTADQLDMICDSHIHVFGPRDVYPVRSESRYIWYRSLLTDYQPFAKRAGVKRIVVVQPSIYGTDNRCTLDAAESLGGNGRAVVDIDETLVTDDELAAMHAQGARGARLGVTLSQKPDAEVLQSTIQRAQAIAKRIAHLPWHIELLSPSWLTAALLPALAKLPVDHCFGHLGGLKAADRRPGGNFDRLLGHLRGAGQRCFVKLSGFYRISAEPRFDDIVPLVSDLAAAAPERMFWGTDFPHPRFEDRIVPDSQLELLVRAVPDGKLRQQILIDNPAKFYGFATTPAHGA
jgi:predicted TIM-barrel fold metal-dependent hydrolase